MRGHLKRSAAEGQRNRKSDEAARQEQGRTEKMRQDRASALAVLPVAQCAAEREDQVNRVAFHNLGCKVNSYELDVMRELLLGRGFEEVPFDTQADVYVINTCTVTNIADRKSRQMLHKAKKENPKAVVIAVGCYVETDPEGVQRDAAIDLAIGNNKKAQIARILEEYLRERGMVLPQAEEQAVRPDKTLHGETMTDLTHTPAYEDMQMERPGHTRAYIKIQDGCNQFCSYCIIPYARGRIRSRRPGEIVREVRHLVQEGIREVVLTGIHISSYGLEWGAEGPVAFDPEKSGRMLLSLFEELSRIEGLSRIRLGSLEPRIMTETFIRGIAALPKICPHFHLSLQSGCDATLRRMNRHYTAAQYLESVRLLRRYYDRPSITTDVIVGFPGEDEEEFSTCVRFCKEVNFYEIHVFKYSVRQGTVAEKLPDQVSPQVKNERSDVLLELTRRQSNAWRDVFAGERQEVLLEEPETVGGRLYLAGHTTRYMRALIPMEEAMALGVHAGDLVCGTVRRDPSDPKVLFLESCSKS